MTISAGDPHEIYATKWVRGSISSLVRDVPSTNLIFVRSGECNRSIIVEFFSRMTDTVEWIEITSCTLSITGSSRKSINKETFHRVSDVVIFLSIFSYIFFLFLIYLKRCSLYVISLLTSLFLYFSFLVYPQMVCSLSRSCGISRFMRMRICTNYMTQQDREQKRERGRVREYTTPVHKVTQYFRGRLSLTKVQVKRVKTRRIGEDETWRVGSLGLWQMGRERGLRQLGLSVK